MVNLKRPCLSQIDIFVTFLAFLQPRCIVHTQPSSLIISHLLLRCMADFKLDWVIGGKYKILRQIGVGSFGMSLSLIRESGAHLTQARFMPDMISIQVKRSQSNSNLVQMVTYTLKTNTNHIKFLAINTPAYRT